MKVFVDSEPGGRAQKPGSLIPATGITKQVASIPYVVSQLACAAEVHFPPSPSCKKELVENRECQADQHSPLSMAHQEHSD